MTDETTLLLHPSSALHVNLESYVLAINNGDMKQVFRNSLTKIISYNVLLF